MKREETLYLSVVILLVGGLVASTNPSSLGVDRLYLFLYWLTRFVIEGGLFIAFRSLLETVEAVRHRPIVLFLTAFATSLVPFVLATTALDIVLGFPELGIEPGPIDGVPFIREFLLEVVYLGDDHLFLCLILSLPRLLGPGRNAAAEADHPPVAATPVPESQPILPMLDPPLDGEIIRLEAQEHYVIVVSTHEQRMVLGRFSDFAATLPPSLGLKVHRSHWVACFAAREAFEENRNMKLRLSNGDVVPVSRRHRQEVMEMLKP